MVIGEIGEVEGQEMHRRARGRRSGGCGHALNHERAYRCWSKMHHTIVVADHRSAEKRVSCETNHM
jgi:hypothetical protein